MKILIDLAVTFPAKSQYGCTPTNWSFEHNLPRFTFSSGNGSNIKRDNNNITYNKNCFIPTKPKQRIHGIISNHNC